MTKESSQILDFYVFPSLIGFFVMLFLSLVALSRGWKKRTNQLFFALVFLGALINLDVALINIVENISLALTIDRATYLLFVFSPPIYIQFVHSFLGLKNRKTIEYLVYALSFLCLLFVPTGHFIAGLQHYEYGRIAQAGPVFHAFSLLVFFAVIYCLKTLYESLQGAEDNLKKNRIKYILVGIGFGALFISLNILPVSGLNIYPMSNFSFVPALILAYGFLKYDLLDIGVVLRKSAGYLLLTGLLSAIYFTAILGVNYIFWNVYRPEELAVAILLAVIVVLLFNPLKERCQKLIARLFYQGKYDYRTLLEQISEKMAASLSVSDIRDLLLDFLFSTFGVRQVSLLLKVGEGEFARYFRGGPGSTKVGEKLLLAEAVSSFFVRERNPASRFQLKLRNLTENERLALEELFAAADAVLAVPLISRHRLIGIICLGEKLSGELFVPEDLSLLSTLANQAAIALENAESYEKLETFNRELEKTVEHRTAALRQALAEKEKAQSRLVRAESLAGIGRLAAGVAHELNNPLAAASSLVQTSLETVAKKNMEEEEREELIDDLQFTLKELKRAAEIVRSLLGVSRQRDDYVEPVNINQVLEDSLRILYSQYKHLEITLEKKYAETLPLLEGNFAELSQVMINIIKNAIQSFSSGQGRINLTTSHQGEEVVIAIADNGRGMTPEEMREIFQPFYTTKPVGEGVGLGLYISQSIVERHGGEITVESKLNQGSIFKVTLPIKRS